MTMAVLGQCLFDWHGTVAERKHRIHSYHPAVAPLTFCSYDKETGTGGSNGATMRFAPEKDHGANAGLAAAQNFMEPVHGK